MASEETNKSLEINASRQFTSWLYEQNVSLSFSTYQAGKLFLLGLDDKHKLSVFERTFERVMGLCVHKNSLYMSTLYQLWRMENTLPEGETYQGYDALYVPQMCYVTGDIDVHDIVASDKGVHFANTLFSCMAEVSETHSFKPKWQPPFISKLAAEDRCHLNGLTFKNAATAYMTAVSQTDVHEGWREHRRDGGVVLDVSTGDVICSGLSMPHSPRWHKGKLWLHDSGNGNFGYINMKKGVFEPVCFCPGYLRGLSFVGDFAIAGISKPRNNKTFQGLALNDLLEEKKISPRCGIQIINLKTGDIEHSLNVEGIVDEIYDVVALPGVKRPMAIGFQTEEIRRMISIDE